MSLTTPQSSLHTSTHISIPLGILIGLLASFVQSLGLTIQRKSHILNQSLPKHQQRVEHRRPLWLLGFTIFILSNLFGSLVQIASLPVVILAPLGAVSLLWNAFFARFILGDVFSPWMILGTILIAGGAVLIAIFGIVPEPTHSLEDLLELFRRPVFIVYFSLLGLSVFLCLIVTHVGEFSWSRKIDKVLEPEGSPPPASPTCTTSYSSEAPILSNNSSTLSGDTTLTEVTPLLDRKMRLARSSYFSSSSAISRTPVLLAISYASISGIISGMCLIFAKSGVELLLLTLGGDNQFGRWESWVLVAGLVVFALLQMWYLHKALVLANPTLVCPSAFCFYNISSILNGLVYFNQLELIKASHLVLVTLGIVILLGGVWVVSIQSGGGGVDVGVWTEEEGAAIVKDDTALSTAEVGYNSHGIGEPEYPDSDSQSTIRHNLGGRKRIFGPVAIQRHTRSEPLGSGLPGTLTAPEMGTSGIPSSHSQAHHRHSMCSTGAVPPAPLRTRFAQRRPTVVGDGRSSHQRNVSYPSAMFSPPTSPGATFGTGFQIGLSAVSPGFAIMPKERRRRLSGIGRGDAEASSGAHERRSVSESDVGTVSLHADPELADDASSSNGFANGESREDGRERRRPWKWLGRVFSK